MHGYLNLVTCRCQKVTVSQCVRKQSKSNSSSDIKPPKPSGHKSSDTELYYTALLWFFDRTATPSWKQTNHLLPLHHSQRMLNYRVRLIGKLNHVWHELLYPTAEYSGVKTKKCNKMKTVKFYSPDWFGDGFIILLRLMGSNHYKPWGWKKMNFIFNVSVSTTLSTTIQINILIEVRLPAKHGSFKLLMSWGSRSQIWSLPTWFSSFTTDPVSTTCSSFSSYNSIAFNSWRGISDQLVAVFTLLIFIVIVGHFGLKQDKSGRKKMKETVRIWSESFFTLSKDINCLTGKMEKAHFEYPLISCEFFAHLFTPWSFLKTRLTAAVYYVLSSKTHSSHWTGWKIHNPELFPSKLGPVTHHFRGPVRRYKCSEEHLFPSFLYKTL